MLSEKTQRQVAEGRKELAKTGHSPSIKLDMVTKMWLRRIKERGLRNAAVKLRIMNTIYIRTIFNTKDTLSSFLVKLPPVRRT